MRTGALMEIKHSIVQEGTVFHAGYIGDSIVGKNCRFGAGFVAGNVRLDKQLVQVEVRDKKIDTHLVKLGAVIGDNSVFGIHSGTMPGVLVGANCKIGPATHVFESLQDGNTLYAKFENIQKANENSAS